MLTRGWNWFSITHISFLQAEGFNATAAEHYDHAIEGYRMAQHPIFYDDNPVKIYLCGKLDEMVDRRSEVASYPIERVDQHVLVRIPQAERSLCATYSESSAVSTHRYRTHRALEVEEGIPDQISARVAQPNAESPLSKRGRKASKNSTSWVPRARNRFYGVRAICCAESRAREPAPFHQGFNRTMPAEPARAFSS